MLKLKIRDGIPKNKIEGIIPIGLILIVPEVSINGLFCLACC
jgi:hypothetical protein